MNLRMWEVCTHASHTMRVALPGWLSALRAVMVVGKDKRRRCDECLCMQTCAHDAAIPVQTRMQMLLGFYHAHHVCRCCLFVHAQVQVQRELVCVVLMLASLLITF